jgi:hypothetical protein
MRNIILITALSAFIILAGFGLYLYIFHNGFSLASDDWGNFGDYISVFINVASLFIVAYISFITNEINQRSLNVAASAQIDNLAFQERQQQPVLDFAVKRPRADYQPTYRESWHLINCSNAAARNISLRLFTGNEVSFFISLYAVQQNDIIEFPWLRFASRLELVFTDPFDMRFFRLVVENLRSRMVEISRDEYELQRGLPHINVANVILQFDERFVALGRQFTAAEYDDLLSGMIADV